MTKETRSKLLPAELAQALKTVGKQIKSARLRRNLSMEVVAARTQCSLPTLRRVEAGDGKVAIATYLRVLWSLKLAKDIELIAKNDPIGRSVQDIEMREKASPRKKRKPFSTPEAAS